jgi:hypothetical protein
MYTIFKFAKYCKILISCTNNDQIPYFCQVYIPDIIYKMHEGEIDSPHKDPLYHIFTSQVFFICILYIRTLANIFRFLGLKIKKSYSFITLLHVCYKYFFQNRSLIGNFFILSLFCELLIFTITISRYGCSTCMYTLFKFAKYWFHVPTMTKCDF